MRLVLPVPPSVNNLYVNVRDRREKSVRYLRWCKRATRALWGQKMTMFTGPVELTITVEDRGQTDLDNFSKALIDFLVHHHFIRDDRREIVRKITLSWAEVEGCIVEVRDAPQAVDEACIHLQRLSA